MTLMMPAHRYRPPAATAYESHCQHNMQQHRVRLQLDAYHCRRFQELLHMHMTTDPSLLGHTSLPF
jgi:hypothetical protein